MSRLDPKTREEAFSYQFEDDVKMLKAVSRLSSDSFKSSLQTLKSHIESYERLSKKKPLTTQP